MSIWSSDVMGSRTVAQFPRISLKVNGRTATPLYFSATLDRQQRRITRPRCFRYYLDTLPDPWKPDSELTNSFAFFRYDDALPGRTVAATERKVSAGRCRPPGWR